MVYNKKRRETLAKCGLKVWIEKAMGETCMHFSLERLGFTAMIAQVMGLKAWQVRCHLWQIDPKDVNAKVRSAHGKTPSAHDKVSSSHTQIPLTGSTTGISTNTTTEKPVVSEQPVFSSFDLLKAEMLSEIECKNFGRLPSDVVQAVVDEVNIAEKAGRIKYTRKAYLTGVLNRKLAELPVKHELGLVIEPVDVINFQPHPLTPCLDGASDASRSPKGEGENSNEVIEWCGKDTLVRDVWGAVLHQLELQLDKASYDVWLKGARFIGWDDGVLTIAVKTIFAKEACEGRLARNITSVLKQICGRDVTIVYEVRDEQAIGGFVSGVSVEGLSA